MNDQDYELFLQEIDADKDMRNNINLYSTKPKKLLLKKNEESKSRRNNNNNNQDDGDDDDNDENENDDEEVRLDELLDAMELNEQNDEVIQNEGVILSVDEAATIPSIQIETGAEFSVSEIDSKEYKFL